MNSILICIQIKHASEKTFNACYRFFFGKMLVGWHKEKEERRKEGRNGWTARKRKRAANEWRLRIIGKRARTENRRSRYPMPLLRAVSVSGDTKTNVFMR